MNTAHVSTGLSGTDPELSAFVEEVGLAFEESGAARMTGRMLGWLLVCEPPHQSAEQLSSVLQASSGSISTVARLLIQLRFVERFAVPADRKTYYKLRSDAWSASLERTQSEMSRFRSLADRGLIAMGDVPVERAGRVRQMRELFSFVEVEFPMLVARFNEAEPSDQTPID